MVTGHQRCVCWESVGVLGVEILVLVEGDLRGLWGVKFSVGVLGVWVKSSVRVVGGGGRWILPFPF